MKKICFVTATRAEYFLLSRLMKKVEEHTQFQLQIVATGMHLSPEFGLTYQDIEKDGFHIDDKVEMLLSSDTPEGISKSMGLAMLGFPAVFQRLQPDLLVILGDRYEMLAVGAVANIFQIPIAHLHGGEKTEGAIDEFVRHSLSKMSYLHFTSTEEYRKRVIQLGEQPDRVFNVGALSIENMIEMDLLSKEGLEESIGFSLSENYALVTFHPVTLEEGTARAQFSQLLSALETWGGKVIFTKANSDTGGRIVNEMIDAQVQKHPENNIGFTSMGILRYLSAMKYCAFILGNSSSGLIETPFFKKPTINIGDRQKGRMKVASILDCAPEKTAILKAIKKAEENEFLSMIETLPCAFGDGTASKQMIEKIECLFQSQVDVKKVFYDIKK